MQEAQTADKFLFVGNQAALDFINTEIMQDGQRISLLENFEDVLAWLVRANLLGAAEADTAKKRWAGTIGADIFLRVLELRKSVRELSAALVDKKPVAPSILAKINALLRQRSGYDEVSEEAGTFRRQFHFSPTQPEHLLFPLAEAAANLLCDTDFSLVKRCDNPACILYFYDTTKNHTRCWCSMSLCGNRHKQAAHHRRKREDKLQRESK